MNTGLGPVRWAAAACGLALAASPVAGQDGDAAPTFARDVAPILYESCAQCHQPAGIGPMSLLDYDVARRYALRIRGKVEDRIMPPWHLDRTVGIREYKNDISLTDEEIGTIVRWVEAGAPAGDLSALPPVPDFPAGADWQLAAELGPPDLVVRSDPYDVIDNGQDQWWGPRVAFEGLDVPRHIRAYEFKPSYPVGRRVVHHGHATLVQPGQGATGIAHYGVGKSYEVFPDDVGMLLPPGPGYVSWNLHYFPVGIEAPDDVVEVGLWLYPEGERPELETRGEVLFRADRMNGMPRANDLLIPPHGRTVIQGMHVMETPARLYSFRPHMHMRGREMSMEAIYPDGRREVLSKVDHYWHTWQIAYQYADGAKPLLPKGTVLLFTAVFDNTEESPLNPDPDQWVVFGRRGVDEMSHCWVGITPLTEEQYRRLVAERERQVADGSQEPGGVGRRPQR